MANSRGWLASLVWMLGGGPYRIVACPACGGDVVIEPSAWTASPVFRWGQLPPGQVLRSCAVDGRMPYNQASKALAAGADPTQLLGRWTTWP